MKKYKGYYIDKVIFNNKQEIDDFIKKQAIYAYKTSVKLFSEHCTFEISIYCDKKAEVLVNQFGFSWEQIEELEIKTLEETA